MIVGMDGYRIASGLLAVLVGVAGGAAGFTFVYARGYSYLVNDPAACANCHVMQAPFDGWAKSSHRAVATCNDCHTPHDFVGKYATKAENGFRHSLAFTTSRFHEPIEITPADLQVTEGACRHCHAEVVAMIDRSGISGSDNDRMSCVRCHREVGHP